jgi:hypothetical protein
LVCGLIAAFVAVARVRLARLFLLVLLVLRIVLLAGLTLLVILHVVIVLSHWLSFLSVKRNSGTMASLRAEHWPMLKP